MLPSLFFIITGLVLYLGATVQVDYSDSFHLFNNARAIIDRLPTYNAHRFIGASVLMVPAFLLEKFSGMEGLGFRLVHLQAALFFILFLFVSYRLFRQTLNEKASFLGLVLLTLTPILFHYAPFAKEDLPASFFLTLGLLLYLGSESRRIQVGISLSFGMAMACRYNLIPIILALVFLDFKRWKSLLGSVLVLFTFPIVLYPWLGRANLRDAPNLFVREMWIQFTTNFSGYKPWWVPFSFFYHTFPVLILLIAILGVLFAFRSSYKRIRFHLFWCLGFLFYQVFVIPGKEMRYLFPVLPSLVLLVMSGYQILEEKFKIKYAAALLGVGLIFGGLSFIRELNRFTDPFYRNSFAKKVSLSAAELGSELYWVGNYYSLRPRVFVFDLMDDFAYVYHFHHHIVEFYSRKKVQFLGGRTIVPRHSAEKGYWLPGIGGLLKDGAVVMVSTELEDNVTRTISEPLPPFVIQRLRKSNYKSAEFISLPDGEYELYVSAKSQGLVSLKKGVLSLSPKVGTEFSLVYFDELRFFSPPI